MIKAVIFDVDGTLLDTERIAMEAWQEAARPYGFAVPDELLRQTRGGGAPAYWQQFRDGVGGEENFEIVRAERWRLAEEWIRTRKNVLRPGVKKLLEALRRRQIPCAVATLTWKENTLAHLECAGIREYFDVLVTGDMVSRSKPDPEVYLKAAALLGIPPEDCMAVEDSTNGVTAALAAGMQVVQIPDIMPPVPELAERCMAVLPQIDGILSLL